MDTLKPGTTLQQIAHLYNSRVSYRYNEYWDWVPYQVNDIVMEAKNILQISTFGYYTATNYDYISPFGKQELTIRNLINGNVSTGGLYDLGQYQQILDSIKAKYSGSLPVTQYILLYDNLMYNTGYSDYEGDAFNNSRWKISHVDPDYFSNSLGVMPNSGAYTVVPINSFVQVGKYEIVYSARDNPKNDSRFDNYKKWSDENLSKLILYVHRRPTSTFLYALTGRDSWGNVNVDGDGEKDVFSRKPVTDINH